jgi:leucyl aminopeptidase (aminopeptidase T)
VKSTVEAEMGSIQYGAEQAVKNCVRLVKDEKVVIITDHRAGHIANEIVKCAQGISPGNIQTYMMEDFGERPEDGGNPLEFPDEIGAALADADVSFYSAAGKKGELQSFRVPMLTAVEANPKLRHAHMPGIDDVLMTTGMSVDYAAVQEMCRKVHEIASNAPEITVTNPAGTEFTATFNPDWRWKISDGQIRAEDWSNLPDGEIFTCVKSIDRGKVVVDGILGDYFSQKYGLLENTPVTLEIEDSRVTRVQCDNEALAAEFREYMKQDENANRIGEFAIGTNIGLEKLVGNLLQDEKFPGIHVAVGHGYPEKTGSDWSSDAHCDAVLKNTTIIVSDRTIMKDGTFTI